MFKKFKFYFGVIFLFLNNFSYLKPMQNGPGGFRFNMFGEQFDINPAADELAQMMDQMARDAAIRRQEVERGKQSKINAIESRINALFSENRRSTMPENEFNARLKSLEKERDTLKNEIEKDKNSAREWEDEGRKPFFSVLGQGVDYIFVKANQARKEIILINKVSEIENRLLVNRDSIDSYRFNNLLNRLSVLKKKDLKTCIEQNLLSLVEEEIDDIAKEVDDIVE